MSKKIFLFCAVAVLAGGLFAGESLKFLFRSTGDTYADGSPVLDGEVYTLVWVADGASFEGFKADGSLVNPVANEITCITDAENGGCDVLFIVEGADAKTNGTYQVFMLDTRVNSTGEDGAVVTTVKGVDDDGNILSVNGYAPVVSAVFTTLSHDLVRSDPFEGNGGGGMVASALPEGEVPQPSISAVTVEKDGSVTIDVANTVPYVQYTISGGASVGAISQKGIATVLNGNAGGTIRLRVANPGECKFFKVVRR